MVVAVSILYNHPFSNSVFFRRNTFRRNRINFIEVDYFRLTIFSVTIHLTQPSILIEAKYFLLNDFTIIHFAANCINALIKPKIFSLNDFLIFSAQN
jgi:hypothetical protein